MPRFDPTTAACRVFTFKEGLLSAVAHDLELEVSRFTIEWDEASGRLEARLDARSVRVLHAMKAGQPAPAALSSKDLATIAGNIASDVLASGRFPEIVFVAEGVARTPAPSALRGTLALHGRTRPVEVALSRRGDVWVGRARLHQPDFGITPYRAMMGTLRVQADVEVEVRVTAP